MSSPPASALAIHSPGLPSPTGTTPSTTKSSIFSSSDSALSTSPPSPTYNHRKPSKRKNQHVRETQETNFGSKRRRVMGRPKNGWTPTRLRKLTRLYLMTNLEVCEIAEVLHEKGFAPKQRDVNTQLSLILQPRPNKIRLGAHVTKTRLRVIRECRDLRRNRRSSHINQRPQNGTEHADFCAMGDTSDNRVSNFNGQLDSSVLAYSLQIPYPRDCHAVQQDSGLAIDSVSWSVEFNGDVLPTVQLGSCPQSQVERELPTHLDDDYENLEWPFWNFELRPGDFSNSSSPVSTSLPTQIVGNSVGEIWPSFEDSSGPDSRGHQAVYLETGVQGFREEESALRLFDSSPTSLLGHDSLPQIVEESLEDLDDCPPFCEGPLPNKGIQSIHLEVPSLFPNLVPPTSIISRVRRPYRPPTTGNYSGSIQFDVDVDIDPTLSTVEPIFTSGELPLSGNTVFTNDLKSKSSLCNGEEPSREKHSGSAGLNERLSFKYSESLLGDINSLLERFTLSSSPRSFVSTTKSSWRSSKVSSPSVMSASRAPTSLSALRTQWMLPLKAKKLSVTLPGAFHLFCWSRMVYQSTLGHCRYDGLLCQHECPTQKFFLSESIQQHAFVKVQIIYRRILSPKINELDAFGNSILHVAASLCSPVQYLMELITNGADINVTNSAGQTFLHLVHAPTEHNDICVLLGILSVRGFKYSQHDDHGQTSLHHLTRPWLPQPYLITVIRKLHSLGFVLPTTRDNLGFTLLDQMNHLGPQLLGFDPDVDIEYRRTFGLTCETKGYIVRPQHLKPSTISTSNGTQYLQNYEKRCHIETLEDLQRYAYHADLLQTIRQAGALPWFEDSRGRNGLHCLAEVDFILPTPEDQSTEANSPKLQSAKVECLREQYLDNLLEAGVNPNNYDKDGHTPLMAFVTHAHATEDDDTTTRILTRLFDAGANVNRRNRRGETALHLAVKLGSRAATKFLLNHGANIHARAKGRFGVVQGGWDASKKAAEDGKLYAQIMLCISLAVSAGAKSSPTILQEWAS